MKAGRKFSLRWLAVFAACVVAYFCGVWSESGLGDAFVIWPASGVALAAVVLFGRRMLSAVFAAMVAGNLLSFWAFRGGPFLSEVPLTLVIALGNTLEPWLAAEWIARRCGGRDAVRSGTNFFRFVCAVIVTHVIGALVGGSAILGAGKIHAEDFGLVLITWWCGSVLGVLIFTPLIFLLARRDFSPFCDLRSRLESVALLTLIFVAGRALAGDSFIAPSMEFPSKFLIIPLLLWMGFCFRGLGVAAALIVLSIVAVTGTMHGYAAFPGLNDRISLLYLQCFLGIIAVVGLGFVAVLDERDDHLAQVESLNAELEDKVTARTRKLERINQELTDTISIVAHDVRGPVAGIRTLAHHMRWASLDLSTAEGNDLLGEIERTSASAVAMMARLLDLQRANDRPDAPVAADIGAVVAEVCGTQENAAREKNIAMTVTRPEGGGLRMVDVEALRFIVLNLVSNAIKFLPVGGAVEVRVDLGDARCRLEVIDNGPGLTPAECAEIFKRFARAANRPTAGEASTGLGLFIVRKLVLAMAGTVHVESVVGEGATFVVEWPAAPAPRAIG